MHKISTINFIKTKQGEARLIFNHYTLYSSQEVTNTKINAIKKLTN